MCIRDSGPPSGALGARRAPSGPPAMRRRAPARCSCLGLGSVHSGAFERPRGALMITAHGVELRIGARVLLEPTSFRVAAGDRIGLVGRNGAGKTTPVSYTHLTLPTIL